MARRRVLAAAVAVLAPAAFAEYGARLAGQSPRCGLRAHFTRPHNYPSRISYTHTTHAELIPTPHIAACPAPVANLIPPSMRGTASDGVGTAVITDSALYLPEFGGTNILCPTAITGKDSDGYVLTAVVAGVTAACAFIKLEPVGDTMFIALASGGACSSSMGGTDFAGWTTGAVPPPQCAVKSTVPNALWGQQPVAGSQLIVDASTVTTVRYGG